MKNIKTKKAVAVAVLSLDQVNHVNQIVDMIADAEKFALKNAELLHASAEKFAYIVGTSPTYELWTTLAKEITEQLIAVKKVAPKTAEKYLTEIYTICRVTFDLEKPRKESKSAVSMARARAELAKKSTPDLKAELAESAKNLRFYSSEKNYSLKLQGVIKAEQSELARSEGKAVTELKNSLKKWIGKLQPNELACLVYVRENFEEVLKLANKKN
jgi:hypothetical protein